MEHGQMAPSQNRLMVQEELSAGGMSLSQHLREVQEEEEQRRQSANRASSPIPSTVDPLFSENPYGLNDNRTAEAAKANAAKRERELSATKRAAQNRAAQRAFRQRKEGHIQELEQQVNRYKALGEAHKQLQMENHQLRDYIATLHATIGESRGEIPHPPPGLELDPSRIAPSLEDQEIMRSSIPTPYAPRTHPVVPAKRKEPSLGTFSTTKVAGGKRQAKDNNPLPEFGPVTIGLRSGDKNNLQNIEPRLMNA